MKPEDDPLEQLKKLKNRILGDPVSDKSLSDLVTGGQDPLEELKKTKHASPTGASLAPLAQGATLGFSDEILGGINGLDRLIHGGSYREGYNEGVAKVRNVGHEFHEEHPVGSVALEVAGGVLPAILSGGVRVPTALAKLPSIVRSAGTGASLGAAAGAGTAEGGTRERLRGAAVGGAAGGVVGAAAPALLSGASKGANVVRTMINRAGVPAEQRANAVIVQALERDKVPLPSLSAAKPTRAPKMLLDMGGENLRGVARAAQAIPSEAKDVIPRALGERHEALGTRLGKDLEDALGVAGKDVHAKADELFAATRANARPLYEEAYKAGPVNDPRINEILELPDFQKAYAQGRAIAKLEGVELPEQLKLSPVAQETLANGSPEAKAAIQAAQAKTAPTVQLLDYVKRGVDDMIRAGRGSSLEAGGLGPTRERALLQRQQELIDLIDRHVPAYKAAREQYSGDLAMERALEMGRQFLKDEPEVTRRTLAGMTRGEKQVFLTGAINNVKREIADAADGADLTRRIFGTATKRANVKALFGDDQRAANQFTEWVKNEARLVKNKNAVLGNSTTAGKLAEISDLSGANIGDVAGSVVTGNPGRAIRDVFRMTASNRLQGVSRNVADELAGKLTAKPGTPQYSQLVEALLEAERRANRVAVRRGVATKAIASSAGGALNQ